MSHTLAVLRREVLDAVGDRHSLRGFVVQTAIIVLLTGIIVPALDPGIWESVAAPVMLYVVFPSTLAATIAADAFAGELERGTLETLLATPLGEWPLLLGKLLAAVMFVVADSALALGAGLVVAAVRGVGPGAGEIGLLLLGVPAGAMVGGLVVADVVLIVSLRVPVARSAQQIGALLTYLTAGGVGAALGTLGRELDWPTVFAMEAALGGVGLLGVFIARRMFRRERLFDE